MTVRPPLTSARIRQRELSHREPTLFDYRPAPEAVAELREGLELLGLRKVRLAGRILPVNDRDFRLEATLGATVVQPCVVTLEPVTTRIDTEVTRTFIADLAEEFAGGSETEMPQDETVEPLGPVIDLHAVLAEALSLALPLYPRAEGAELGEARFCPPGAEPPEDEGVRPLASLAEYRERLAGKSEGEPEGPGDTPPSGRKDEKKDG